MFDRSATICRCISVADGAGEQGDRSLCLAAEGKGGSAKYYRPCRADYKQEHYAANRQRYLDNAQKRKQVMLRVRTSFLLEFFTTHPCVDCGETDPIVLEFEHLSDKCSQ